MLAFRVIEIFQAQESYEVLDCVRYNSDIDVIMITSVRVCVFILVCASPHGRQIPIHGILLCAQILSLLFLTVHVYHIFFPIFSL